MTVSGFEVRNQVNEFIYEYEFGVPAGVVNLDEVELVESEAIEPQSEEDNQ
jgi:hypothetical protein